MALKIALDSACTNLVTAGNPITTTHPTTGSVQSVQLWLFNDDSTKTYQSISIDPTDATGGDESSWITLAPDSSGAAGTYLGASAPLSVANITVSGSPGKIPFWMKVTTPNNQVVSNKQDINLTVNYTEYAV